jgi:hypothetical protein
MGCSFKLILKVEESIVNGPLSIRLHQGGFYFNFNLLGLHSKNTTAQKVRLDLNSCSGICNHVHNRLLNEHLNRNS